MTSTTTDVQTLADIPSAFTLNLARKTTKEEIKPSRDTLPVVHLRAPLTPLWNAHAQGSPLGAAAILWEPQPSAKQQHKNLQPLADKLESPDRNRLTTGSRVKTAPTSKGHSDAEKKTHHGKENDRRRAIQRGRNDSEGYSSSLRGYLETSEGGRGTSTLGTSPIAGGGSFKVRKADRRVKPHSRRRSLVFESCVLKA